MYRGVGVKIDLRRNNIPLQWIEWNTWWLPQASDIPKLQFNRPWCPSINSFTSEEQLPLVLTALEMSFEVIPSKSFYSIKGWVRELPVHKISLAKVGRECVSHEPHFPPPSTLLLRWFQIVQNQCHSHISLATFQMRESHRGGAFPFPLCHIQLEIDKHGLASRAQSR